MHYGWYHQFLGFMLQHHWYAWFGKLVAFGETAIGILLILGAFVGVVAFFGAFMNFNFMLAGSASTNPVLFTLAILLLLAWKIAGYYGAGLRAASGGWCPLAEPRTVRAGPRGGSPSHAACRGARQRVERPRKEVKGKERTRRLPGPLFLFRDERSSGVFDSALGPPRSLVDSDSVDHQVGSPFNLDRGTLRPAAGLSQDEPHGSVPLARILELLIAPP